MPVIAYTDGAANNALPLGQRAGGWAVVMMVVDQAGRRDERPETYKEISGSVPSATNNQMELEAVRQALLALKGRTVQITVISDSAYVIGVLSMNWKVKENVSLVQEIKQIMRLHRVTFQKVKGHAGHEYNERADVLAVAERKKRETG